MDDLVSVVIPTYNRGVRVRDAIQKCLALRPAPREILIVDVEQIAGLRVAHQPATEGRMTASAAPAPVAAIAQQAEALIPALRRKIELPRSCGALQAPELLAAEGVN